MLTIRENLNSPTVFGEVLILLVFCAVLCSVLFVFVLCLVCQMLPVSLDCPFVIVPSVFCIIYIQQFLIRNGPGDPLEGNIFRPQP